MNVFALSLTSDSILLLMREIVDTCNAPSISASRSFMSALISGLGVLSSASGEGRIRALLRVDGDANEEVALQGLRGSSSETRCSRVSTKSLRTGFDSLPFPAVIFGRLPAGTFLRSCSTKKSTDRATASRDSEGTPAGGLKSSAEVPKHIR